MVNHYYFYCVDEDFGPFFLKFCSYFPYNAKLCINGHEHLKHQLGAIDFFQNRLQMLGKIKIVLFTALRPSFGCASKITENMRVSFR
jgi:hypothetical protein